MASSAPSTAAREERENLFTRKTASTFFRAVQSEADSRDEVAVLLKGFDASQRNLILDDSAHKSKQASREHTIQARAPVTRPAPLTAPISAAVAVGAHAL